MDEDTNIWVKSNQGMMQINHCRRQGNVNNPQIWFIKRLMRKKLPIVFGAKGKGSCDLSPDLTSCSLVPSALTLKVTTFSINQQFFSHHSVRN